MRPSKTSLRLLLALLLCSCCFGLRCLQTMEMREHATIEVVDTLPLCLRSSGPAQQLGSLLAWLPAPRIKKRVATNSKENENGTQRGKCEVRAKPPRTPDMLCMRGCEAPGAASASLHQFGLPNWH